MKADSANSPLATLNTNWGGSGYPMYDGYANTPVVAAPSAPPADAPPAAPSAGTPAAPASPAAGASPASPTGNPNDENIRVLREGHAEASEWRKLGDREDVAATYQAVTKVRANYAKVAEQLGYDSDDFTTAFRSDPFKTMRLIEREYAAAQKDGSFQGKQDMSALIRKEVEKIAAPLREQQNAQLSEKANNLFDITARAEIKAAFPNEDLPAEVSEFLFDMTSEILKYDADGVKALKVQGQTAAVKKAVATAREMFTKAFTAYQAHQQKRTPGAGGVGPKGGAEKPKVTLDDIIAGNDKAKAALPSMRG